MLHTHPLAHPSLSPGSQMAHPMEIFLCWNLIAFPHQLLCQDIKGLQAIPTSAPFLAPGVLPLWTCGKRSHFLDVAETHPLLSCQTSSPALLAALRFPDPVHQGTDPEEGEAILGVAPYSEWGQVCPRPSSPRERGGCRCSFPEKCPKMLPLSVSSYSSSIQVSPPLLSSSTFVKPPLRLLWICAFRSSPSLWGATSIASSSFAQNKF